MKTLMHPLIKDTVPTLPASMVEKELTTSKARIEEHGQAIAGIFKQLGYADTPEDVKITIGPEIEVTEVAGKKSWKRRTAQIKQQMRQSEDGTFSLNSKDDSYMPKSAQIAHLNTEFAVSEKLGREKSNNVVVELEPTFKSNVGTRFRLRTGKNGNEQYQEPAAFSQIEFTSPPRSPLGCAAWISKMYDVASNAIATCNADGQRKYELKLLDCTATPHAETAPNSIHLNSVINVKGKNALSASEWEGASQLGMPSDLLLCIGKAQMEYLKHSIFMFARAESDYNRFSREELSGPTFIAIPSRKKHGEFSTAMFRGEERKTERTNSAYPDKKDKGPLRFELRVPCPGAAGHPNKTAYPEQAVLPYEMLESYMHMLRQGVELWHDRELARRAGEKVEALKEKDFAPNLESLGLPASKKEALDLFLQSPAAKDYWGERIDTLLALSDQQDVINKADRNPYTREKGAHINRR